MKASSITKHIGTVLTLIVLIPLGQVHAQSNLYALVENYPAPTAGTQVNHKALLTEYVGDYRLPGGLVISVQTDGRRLILSSEGIEAYEMLTAEQANTSLNKTTLQTQGILNGWAAGEADAHRKAVGDDEKVFADIQRMISTLETGYGPIQSYTMLNTSAASNHRRQSFALVQFQNKLVELRFVWKDGKLVTTYPVARKEALAVVAAPVPGMPTEAQSDTPCWIRFEQEQPGAAAVLTIQGPRGQYTATRI